LFSLLQFTQAQEFRLAHPNQEHPVMATPRTSTPRRVINQTGIDLIKKFEGLHLEAYLDPVNIWTIGYGHIQGVAEGMKISPAEAENLLRQDLVRFENAVSEAVKIDLNDNQFAALTSFCFNLGANSLFQSTLLKLLNQNKIAAAADEFPRWDKAGGQSLLGLSRRRRAERALFLGEPWESFITWKPSTTLRYVQGKPLMKGLEVKKLQQALIRHGVEIIADGIFGRNTKKAVIKFQQQNNLIADGIVGDKTKQKLGIV
ncbi:MAG: glycoside hydrolase family protein, partial [Cyanobacteria bacterium J06623_7]